MPPGLPPPRREILGGEILLRVLFDVDVDVAGIDHLRDFFVNSLQHRTTPAIRRSFLESFQSFPDASELKVQFSAFRLAPFIGVACPGVIERDGSIEKGAPNLPGNWESSKFNLPRSLVEAILLIGE